MPGKIFTAYHFLPTQYRADDLYTPVIMGDAARAISPATLGHGNFLSDPDNDEISRENSYAENRVRWYAYKHQARNYAWLGFEQYRRGIDFGTRTNAEIAELAMSHDIITCTPLSGAHNTNRGQYKACHIPAHWDVFEHLLETLPLPINRNIPWAYTSTLIPHAMGTMQTEEFLRYMEQWKIIFSAFAKIVSPPDDPYQRRVYAFLSERFFSLYIYRLLAERPRARVMWLSYRETAQVPAT